MLYKHFRSYNGVPFRSYLGIPYAQAPVGPLLLKKPVAALPWNGTFQADQSISCLQVRIKKKHFNLLYPCHNQK